MKRPRGDDEIKDTVHSLVKGDLTSYNHAASVFLKLFHGEDADDGVYENKGDYAVVWLKIADIETKVFSNTITRFHRTASITVQIIADKPLPVCMKLRAPRRITVPKIDYSAIVQPKIPRPDDLSAVANGIIVAMETQGHVATVSSNDDAGIVISATRSGVPEMVVDLTQMHKFVGDRPVAIRISVTPAAFELRPSFLRFI